MLLEPSIYVQKSVIVAPRGRQSTAGSYRVRGANFNQRQRSRHHFLNMFSFNFIDHKKGVPGFTSDDPGISFRIRSCEVSRSGNLNCQYGPNRVYWIVILEHFVLLA